MKKTILILAVFFCVFALFAADYEIDSLDMEVVVGRNAVNTIKESYVFNYGGPHHGFYRYIPKSYRTGDVKRNIRITDVRCSDPFDTDTEDGFFIMKIGSASETYTGRKSYTISYNYDIGADTNEGYDEFYFNLVGDGWEIPINKASFSVTVPCALSEAQIWVTYGRRGSTAQVPFNVKNNGSSITITGTVDNINAGEAVTIRVQLPDSWYESARTAWDFRSLFTTLGFTVSLICVALAALAWIFAGRDRVPIVTARFEAPDGLSPLPVGYVADGQVDDKDITSMIYYWADAGYLSIAEPKKNKFEFTKLKDLPKDTPSFERKLFDGLFKRGDVVSIKDLERSNFADVVVRTKISTGSYFRKERALEDSKSKALSALFFAVSIIPMALFILGTFLQEYSVQYGFFLSFPAVAFCLINNAIIRSVIRKWYVTKSKIASIVGCLIPSVVIFLILSSVLGFVELQMNFSLLLVCVLCSTATGFFSAIIVRRSEYGNKLLEQILGYREFIQKVTIDELKLMIKDNPDYYYKVLSYAIVLGLEDTWAKKFASITVPAPSWYVGDSLVDAYFFSHMSSRMNNSFRSTVLSTTGGGSHSVGGGGFGSSGFSGGGFGGGGGHAW